LESIKTLLTYCVRGVRFCDGHWESIIQSGYGFLISVLERDSDYLRINIFEMGSGDVVYDSQPGNPADADPTTELGGGSIVIHK
jgi:hypothetical protein